MERGFVEGVTGYTRCVSDATQPYTHTPPPADAESESGLSSLAACPSLRRHIALRQIDQRAGVPRVAAWWKGRAMTPGFRRIPGPKPSTIIHAPAYRPKRHNAMGT